MLDSLAEWLLAPYLATANSVDLALERDRLHTALGFGSLRGFSWGLDYKHEDRDGNRPYGASFGFSNATELPEVIDYSIDDTELAGACNTERAGVRFHVVRDGQRLHLELHGGFALGDL